MTTTELSAVPRTEVAKVIEQLGVSRAKSRMFVHLAAAELELPAGDLSPRVAGEVETIAARKARQFQAVMAK